MNDELDPVERRLGDLFNQVSAPASMRRYESSGGFAPAPVRWWSRPLRALFSAGGERRLRPLAAALVLPLLVLALGGGLQLRAHFSGTAGSGASPPARAGAAMAFDAGHGVVVMFGGMSDPASGLGDLGDTWTWDGGSWMPQHPATTPSPRTDAVMGYDAARNQVVLFGGTVKNPPGWGTHESQETWTWDGSSWHLVTTAHRPDGLVTGMAYDGEHNQLMLVAERASMQTISDSASASGGGCTNSGDSQECSVFQSISGGLSQGGSAPAASAQAMPVSPPAPPLPGHGPITAPQPNLQTWTWTGSDWHLQSPNMIPAGWPNLPPAFDAAARHVVLLTSQASKVSCLYATLTSCPTVLPWAWDGRNWTQTQVGKGVSPGAGIRLVSDPATGRPLGVGADQTWSWTGSRWTTHANPAGLIGRGGFALASDTTDHQVVLFGGRRGAQFGADTWTWDGSTWTHRAGTVPPALPAPSPPSPGVVKPAPPACKSIALWVSPSAGPRVLINVVLPQEPPSCFPGATGAAVALLDDPSGTLTVGVTGNPFRLGTRTAVTLVWTNYCGSKPPSGVELIGADGARQVYSLTGSPTCTNRAKPSTLTLAPTTPVVPPMP